MDIFPYTAIMCAFSLHYICNSSYFCFNLHLCICLYVIVSIIYGMDMFPYTAIMEHLWEFKCFNYDYKCKWVFSNNNLWYIIMKRDIRTCFTNIFFTFGFSTHPYIYSHDSRISMVINSELKQCTLTSIFVKDAILWCLSKIHPHTKESHVTELQTSTNPL